MALPFSNTAGRTLERLKAAFIETARGAREVVGAPLRPDLPDDDVPRLKSRIDACLEGKGGETARRGRNVLRGNTSFGCQNVLEPHVMSVGNHWYPDVAGGNLGPPPRPGHRSVAGAGPEPASQEPPSLTPAPGHLAPPPDPLKPLLPAIPSDE